LIKTIGLEKEFGNTIAVKDLNLDIQEGEVFGFLGPNGAGKTTTIRMLSSLIAPTRGDAFVNGYKIGIEDQKIRSSVGVLTETPGLYDNLSADQNLRFFANLYEVNDISGQIEKYLKMLGLWDRRFDTVGTFSKGMKQKLAIARTLLHEPRTLFFDEPTAGLDPEAAHLLRDFIADLRKSGRTIFICTHNLDEADRLCDRIGVFKTRLIVVDTPSKLRSSLFGRKIVFHLQIIEDEMISSIVKFDYVKNAKVVDNKIVVTLDDPEIRNPELIRTLINDGAQITFVGELRHSLEDVYLQLVQSAV
jgi:ABC-2 type transport system ATP-binding protein